MNELSRLDQDTRRQFAAALFDLFDAFRQVGLRRSCYATATLLLRCCVAAATLLLRCCYAAATLLLLLLLLLLLARLRPPAGSQHHRQPALLVSAGSRCGPATAPARLACWHLCARRRCFAPTISRTGRGQ